MKLVASLMAGEKERDRYLDVCVHSLLEFCDEVAILLDGNWKPGHYGAFDMGFGVYSEEERDAIVWERSSVSFYENEGRARQALVDFTLTREPTHVLAIDADEFIEDGTLLRASLQDDGAAWDACMQEIWTVSGEGLEVRQDGGWAEHDVPLVWAPERLSKPHRIMDRPLACGRVPMAARGALKAHTGTAVLHFGWANPNEREARYARYVEHDGGQYHARSHLDSILAPSPTLSSRPWPTWTNRRQTAVLEAATR